MSSVSKRNNLRLSLYLTHVWKNRAMTDSNNYCSFATLIIHVFNLNRIVIAFIVGDISLKRF